MAENKFKYFTITTTSIVKAPTVAEAQRMESAADQGSVDEV